MIDVESPYTVADLSRNPSGVSGDEFAGLGFSNSITNRKCLDHSESLSWRNLVFFFFFEEICTLAKNYSHRHEYGYASEYEMNCGEMK